MKIFIIDTGYFFTYIVLVKTRITIDKAKFGQMWNFSGGQIRWQQQIFPRWHARWFYNLFIVLWEFGKLRVVRLENRKKKCSAVGISLESTKQPPLSWKRHKAKTSQPPIPSMKNKPVQNEY